jgi:hypothetical protein
MLSLFIGIQQMYLIILFRVLFGTYFEFKIYFTEDRMKNQAGLVTITCGLGFIFFYKKVKLSLCLSN